MSVTFVHLLYLIMQLEISKESSEWIMILSFAKIWPNWGQNGQFVSESNFFRKIDYYQSCLPIELDHIAAYQTNLLNWLLDIMLYNFGQHWSKLPIFLKINFVGKLTVAIVYLLYSQRIWWVKSIIFTNFIHCLRPSSPFDFYRQPLRCGLHPHFYIKGLSLTSLWFLKNLSPLYK